MEAKTGGLLVGQDSSFLFHPCDGEQSSLWRQVPPNAVYLGLSSNASVWMVVAEEEHQRKDTLFDGNLQSFTGTNRGTLNQIMAKVVNMVKEEAWNETHLENVAAWCEQLARDCDLQTARLLKEHLILLGVRISEKCASFGDLRVKALKAVARASAAMEKLLDIRDVQLVIEFIRKEGNAQRLKGLFSDRQSALVESPISQVAGKLSARDGNNLDALSLFGVCCSTSSTFRLLMLGEMGAGKSSLLRGVFNCWAQDGSPWDCFAAVVFVDLREIVAVFKRRSPPSWSMFEILKIAWASYGTSEQQIRLFVERLKNDDQFSKRILWIIDGWDETFDLELKGDLYDISIGACKFVKCLIAGSRPDVAVKLSKMEKEVSIEGFGDSKEIRKYVERYFSSSAEAESLWLTIETNAWLMEACKLPQLLNIVCFLGNVETSKRRSDIYSRVVSKLITLSKINKMKKAKKALGEMALVCLKENVLIVEESSLQDACKSKNLADQVKSLGLLCETPAGFSWLHRSFLDFLAADEVAGWKDLKKKRKWLWKNQRLIGVQPIDYVQKLSSSFVFEMKVAYVDEPLRFGGWDVGESVHLEDSPRSFLRFLCGCCNDEKLQCWLWKRVLQSYAHLNPSIWLLECVAEDRTDELQARLCKFVRETAEIKQIKDWVTVSCKSRNVFVLKVALSRVTEADDLRDGVAVAAQFGHIQMLDAFAAHAQGSDLFSCELPRAIQRGQRHIVDWLLAKGANPSVGVYAAVCSGDIELVRRLLSLGANPNGSAPVHEAWLRDGLDELLEKISGLKKFPIPLFKAIELENVEMVEFLAKNNEMTRFGLRLAKPDSAIWQLLLQRGK